jgi:acetyl-CoA carboxylase carboxyl transferase subunit alpha
MIQSLRRALVDELARQQAKPIDELLEIRYQRLMSYGKYKETSAK